MRALRARREERLSTPLFLFLTFWMEHNQRTFERVQRANQSLKDSLISVLYMWSCGYVLVDGQAGLLSLIDFVEWLCSETLSTRLGL